MKLNIFEAIPQNEIMIGEKRMKRISDEQVKFMKVRSGIKAGRVVCVDVPDDNPYPPVPPTPIPQPPAGSGPWLTCQSCHGAKVAEGQLKNAKCEVCTL